MGWLGAEWFEAIEVEPLYNRIIWRAQLISLVGGLARRSPPQADVGGSSSVVELHPSKVDVEGSNPFSRFLFAS